ncbi:MAG: calcium/sodium antiporter [Candidatus Krumholzibacteria bacterium]|nr:calcium/sodium antiporter [Candidatus Krumholzibacteria bacterium]
MGLTPAILFALAGFLLLAGGGEVLVRGAVSVSRRLGISTSVIGLTVVAMATSLPELAVSLVAALRGNPDLAVGNVVGSNIFNLAVILAVTAVLFPPLRFRANLIRVDVAFMTATMVLAVGLARDGEVDSREGVLLLALLAGFLVYRARSARRPDVPHGEVDERDIAAELAPRDRSRLGVARSFALVFAGAALLTAGGELLVRGAVVIAEIAGVSQRVIAVTLVSVGTSLPELATCVMAGVRRHSAVAVGNLIGSNIFNTCGILGTVAVTRTVGVSHAFIARDMWWMLGFCLVAIVPAVARGRGISRTDGVLALAAYVVYLATLL